MNTFVQVNERLDKNVHSAQFINMHLNFAFREAEKIGITKAQLVSYILDRFEIDSLYLPLKQRQQSVNLIPVTNI